MPYPEYFINSNHTEAIRLDDERHLTKAKFNLREEENFSAVGIFKSNYSDTDARRIRVNYNQSNEAEFERLAINIHREISQEFHKPFKPL